MQDHKKRHCFKLWIQIVIKLLLLKLLITDEGTYVLVPKSRFRNLGTVIEVITIAHVAFQGCAGKEFLNSVLCQLKLLTLKKSICLTKHT